MEFWQRLLQKPTVAVQATVATVFISMLALAQPLAAINIFNNYLQFGLNGTLYVIATGAALAILFEAILRQARHKELAKLCDERDTRVFGKVNDKQALSNFFTIRNSFGAKQMADWLDIPTATLFVAVLTLMHWSLGLITVTFLALVYGVTWLSDIMTDDAAEERQETLKALLLNGAILEDGFSVALEQSSKAESKKAFFEHTQRLLGSVMAVSLLSVGAVLTFAGSLTAGELLAANILGTRAYMILAKWLSGAHTRANGQKLLDYIKATKQTNVDLNLVKKEKSNAA